MPGDEIESREDAKRPVERLVMCDDFEQWLRMTCFQAPQESCYQLAKSAWNQAVKMAAAKAFYVDKSTHPTDLGDVIEKMVSDT